MVDRTGTVCVTGMTCRRCVVAVQRSLRQVPSVGKGLLSFAKAEAAVTFDDVRTDVDMLIKGNDQRWYPSTSKRQGNQPASSPENQKIALKT